MFIIEEKKSHSTEPVVEPWTYFWCFGFLNLIAVVTQLSWPTAPPWYVEAYGDIPPSYTMAGEPAGLERVDDLLQFPLFSSLYGSSPIVFGSFPSLHAAWPLMMTIFFPPQKVIKGIGIFYTAVVWWAAMYLNHHYFIDLVGGGVYVLFSYLLGVSTLELVKTVFKDKMFSKRTFRFVRMAKNKEDIELSFIECGGGEDEDTEVELEQLQKQLEEERVKNRATFKINPINKKTGEEHNRPLLQEV